MKKDKMFFIVGSVFITILGVLCLVLSKPFYEELFKCSQYNNLNLGLLLQNLLGILLSFIIGNVIILLIVSFFITEGKMYLGERCDKYSIYGILKLNIPFIIMALLVFLNIFSRLSLLFLLLIGLYTSSLILTMIVLSWLGVYYILKANKGE